MSWVQDLALLRDWFTQRELADAIDVCTTTIEKWAGNKCKPAAPQKRKIMWTAARVRHTLETAPPYGTGGVAESQSGRKPERRPGGGGGGVHSSATEGVVRGG